MKRAMLAALLLFCIGAAHAQPAEVALRPRIDAQLSADLPLIDDQGRQTSLRNAQQGRPAVLAFVYFDCPMLCSEVLNGLVRVLQEVSADVGSDFEVVVVSIDPHDRPSDAADKKEQLVRRYGRGGSGRGWHVLVGRDEDVRALADEAGFQYAKIGNEYAHPSGLFVLTPSGRISHAFTGVDYPPNDVRLALIQASNGRAGGFVEKLQLLCFRYDPTRSRYGPWIFGSLRAASVLTVLGLLVGIARARRNA